MASKPKASAAPAAPTPQNEYNYVDGTLQSSRTKDSNGWATNVYRTPEEQNIEKQSTKFISDLIPQAQQAFNVSPEGIQQYKDAYTQPQMRALNDAYNQSYGAATNSAGASGMRNSVGFENYRTNQLDKNRAQGAADIAANAEQMGYQLPSMRLQPFADAFNLYNAALNGEQSDQTAQANQAMQGSQLGNNFALQNYANQLSAFNASKQPGAAGNFFGRMFGVV